MRLPAISIRTPNGLLTAINDISFQRLVGGRVAQLAYGVEDEEVGSVRCDGLVICTAAGSTGYNLANGGPVMAWGVEGFGVSFIAPHSLTARALVVAPDDALSVSNRGREAVDVFVDGRPACQIAPGDELVARYEPDAALLAQLTGLVLLPPPAREVRTPLRVTVTARARLAGSVGRRWYTGRQCSPNCASRTSC